MNSVVFLARQLSVIFIFLAVAPCVFAFQSASLQIFVTDQKDDLVSVVRVRLRNSNGFFKEIRSSNQQFILFHEIMAGGYVLEVDAKGFKPYLQQIEIKSGKNEATVKLDVAEIIENVNVTRDRQETATEEVFSNFLTREQIAALPDDPDDLEKELKKQFGNDVVIRVDGFSGRLPSKSQIASIKISRSSFDAEFHQLGATIIDVTTKAGFGKWSGSATFNFNDDFLNARNPIAAKRFPLQQRLASFFLSGPLMKNRSSIFVSLYDNDLYKDTNIFAVLPNGQFKNSARASSRLLAPWVKFTQNLSKTHTLGINYQGQLSRSENNGVGGFNLPERGFSSRTSNQQLRISEIGNLGTRFLNEFRLQLTDETTAITPSTDKAAIIVLDAFSSGGAGNKNNSRKKSIWAADNLLFGVGKFNAVKIGGLFEYERRDTRSETNQNGTYTFSSLDSFMTGRPSVFTQSPGQRKVSISQAQVGAYIQDDIRLYKSFLVSTGLRYEWQSNLSDYNNFSPRIGFSWSPNRRGKITFRGGAGVYYNWFDTDSLSTILSQNKSQLSEINIINPGYPNPFSGGFSQILPQSYRQKAENLENPYVFLTSFGVDQRLKNTAQLRVLYKYQKGVHQFRSHDINAPVDFVRPNPALGKIVQVESSAIFVQNSLNVSLNQRLNQIISYSLDYTLAKRISDNDGIFGLPSNNYNLSLDRSATSNDQRHRIYTSVFCRIYRSMNVSTNFVLGSPLPYTITTGRDDNGDTIFNDRPSGFRRNSARGTWQKQVDMSLSWTIGLVKISDGKAGMPGTIALTSAEVASGDIGIDPTKKYSIKFYATANNILNQTNFTNFVGVQTSPLFGRPVSASGARKIELGMRFSF